MQASRLGLAVLLSSAAYPAVPAVAATVALAPHRAVYDVVLDNANDRTGITGLSGRMVYEFNGSPCEGYTVKFRMVTQINTGETSRMTDQQTTTFEEGDGKSFSFVTKSYVDSNLDKEVKGSAQLETNGLKVDIEKPETATVDLSKTQFPTQHLIEVIDKAEKGETFFETSLFDGSEDADKVMTTTVVVGKPFVSGDGDPEAKPLAALAKDKYWPIDIAYFDLSSEDGEEVPEYRISMKLHENGLTRDLMMDYGDFSMRGKLVNLTMFPAPKDCAPK